MMWVFAFVFLVWIRTVRASYFTVGFYATSSDVEIYSNAGTTLDVFTPISATPSGGYVASPTNLLLCEDTSSTQTATSRFYIHSFLEGTTNVKAVRLQFTLEGGTIFWKITDTRYYSDVSYGTTCANIIGTVFPSGHTDVPIATCSGCPGYGISSLTFDIANSPTSQPSLQPTSRPSYEEGHTFTVADAATTSDVAIYYSPSASLDNFFPVSGVPYGGWITFVANTTFCFDSGTQTATKREYTFSFLDSTTVKGVRIQFTLSAGTISWKVTEARFYGDSTNIHTCSDILGTVFTSGSNSPLASCSSCSGYGISTFAFSVTHSPSSQPSSSPSSQPSSQPSLQPTNRPSYHQGGASFSFADYVTTSDVAIYYNSEVTTLSLFTPVTGLPSGDAVGAACTNVMFCLDTSQTQTPTSQTYILSFIDTGFVKFIRFVFTLTSGTVYWRATEAWNNPDTSQGTTCTNALNALTSATSLGPAIATCSDCDFYGLKSFVFTVSLSPTISPSLPPTVTPTTYVPTLAPTVSPSVLPSLAPSLVPTVQPSTEPSARPSNEFGSVFTVNSYATQSDVAIYHHPTLTMNYFYPVSGVAGGGFVAEGTNQMFCQDIQSEQTSSNHSFIYSWIDSGYVKMIRLQFTLLDSIVYWKVTNARFNHNVALGTSCSNVTIAYAAENEGPIATCATCDGYGMASLTFEVTFQPTSQPSMQPSSRPSAPTRAPTIQPSSMPIVGSVSDTMASSPTYKVRNAFAFAAFNGSGHVFTWGAAVDGGDSSSVSHYFKNVTEIVSARRAFAALNSDGSVVAWGASQSITGSSVYRIYTTIVSVHASESAFALLSRDGAVYCFGNTFQGGNMGSVVSTTLSSEVIGVVANAGAFAAWKSDGSVYCWGSEFTGGGVSSLTLSSLVNVVSVYATRSAFAARLTDGSVVTWGAGSGGKVIGVGSYLTSSVSHVVGAAGEFVAVKSDTSLVAWGAMDNEVVTASALASNVFVAHTEFAVAVLKSDGSVFAWGESEYGGSTVNVALANIAQLYATRAAFAAVNSTGGVTVWGSALKGGDASGVTDDLTKDVKSIVATNYAFAALKSDGSVVVWGDETYGGSVSADVSNLLKNVVKLCSNELAFTAITSGGSGIVWGHPFSIGGGGVLLKDVWEVHC